MNLSTTSRFIDRLHEAYLEGDPTAEAVKPAEADNVRRLQDVYRALAAGDAAAFAGLLAEDVELDIHGPPQVPFIGHWVGRPQVVAAVRRNFAMLEDQQPEVTTVVAQGDSVVVVARERGRVKATGRDYDLHVVQLFTFRAGTVARVREYFDSQPILSALQPAG
jgi:ketosteroid isomerase-like protein